MACGARLGLKPIGPLQWHLGEDRWREAHQGGQKRTAATSDEHQAWQPPAPGWQWSETRSSPAAGCRCDCAWSDERARRLWASVRPRDERSDDRVCPQNETTKGWPARQTTQGYRAQERVSHAWGR